MAYGKAFRNTSVFVCLFVWFGLVLITTVVKTNIQQLHLNLGQCTKYTRHWQNQYSMNSPQVTSYTCFSLLIIVSVQLCSLPEKKKKKKRGGGEKHKVFTMTMYNTVATWFDLRALHTATVVVNKKFKHMSQ